MFNEFMKCGGLLKCDYVTNKCRFVQLYENKFTNKTCTIDPSNKEDIRALDYLLWTESCNYGAKMYYDIDKINRIRFHHYQNENVGGFIIDQKDPYEDPYKVSISSHKK